MITLIGGGFVVQLIPAVMQQLTRFQLTYDTRCYFNVCLKGNMSQLNIQHGNDN